MTLGNRLCAAFVLVFSACAAAYAADTGSVSGAVFHQNGDPAAGATVRISGAALGIGRYTLTAGMGF
jgi:hypothetical protein